jgi:hypothetical protein
MKMTMAWRGNKKTRKPVRVAHKPKIRWDQLGFVGSLDAQAPTSIEEIRLQVTALASRGIGADTRARSAKQGASLDGLSHRKRGEQRAKRAERQKNITPPPRTI